MKFIILGAGLSGITCGLALQTKGHQVVIIEKDSEAGGLARSVRFNGYTFDYGPHLLFGPKIVPLLKTLIPNLELKQIERNKERMYFREKYFNFPFEPKNLLKNIGLSHLPGVIYDIFIKNPSSLSNATNIENVEEWVVRSVGRRIYDYISLGGYVESLYGLPATQIDKEWGIQKLKFLARLRDKNLFQLFSKSMLEKKKLKQQVVNYPVGGAIDLLSQALVNKFLADGGRLWLKSQATRIETDGSGVKLTYRQNGQLKDVGGDFLISTLPVTNLVNMLETITSNEIRSVAIRLRYRATILLFLCVKKSLISNFLSIYYTENQFSFRRITEFKHLDQSMAPSDKTSLCVEITCSKGDTLFNSNEQTLFDLVIGQQKKLGFINKNDVETFRVVKLPHAYPIYEVGHGLILKKVLTFLQKCPNLITIGRQGLFFYNNMSNSIIDAYELGQKLSRINTSNWQQIIDDTYQTRLNMYRSSK